MPDTRKRARRGVLETYSRSRFEHGGFAHDVYRKGRGPAVLVLGEFPGISAELAGLGDQIVEIGCTAILPSLIGTAGRPYAPAKTLERQLYGLRTFVKTCISREFSIFALGKSSPVIDWLRALAAIEHARCGGPGVGVVGCCFSGGFALAMAADPLVLAPVMSQPSLPPSISKRHRASIDASEATIDCVAARCANEGLRVLGLRFKGDPFVPEERFAFLRERLGDGFVAIELDAKHGRPDTPAPTRIPHSVLTLDLIDEPGEPTRAALDQVLQLFRTKLLVSQAEYAAT